ncbi:MAG: AAA family ATPase [bacterium]
MINKVYIKNFRSIKEQEVELAPIVILCGPTGSGKTSFLYSILAFKNLVTKSNQPIDQLFNFNFINLGYFEQLVFKGQTDNFIEIQINNENGLYKTKISEKIDLIIESSLDSQPIELSIQISLPYNNPISKLKEYISVDGKKYLFTWNGFWVEISSDPADETNLEIQRKFNSIPEELRRTDIAPQRRGFFNFQYPITTHSNIPVTDQEVASIIASDNNLQIDISYYLEEISSTEFRVYIPVKHTSSPSVCLLQTRYKGSREFTSIVNEGFGINQIVYTLAKVLYHHNTLVMIEEPEIHLHPQMIRNFIRTLCQILTENRGKKQIMMITHSENIVFSVLAAVKQKIIKPEDITAYLVIKENKETKFIRQRINEHGQIEGGLINFTSAQLEDIRIFLDMHE